MPASLKINTVVKLGDRSSSDTLPADLVGPKPAFLQNVKLKSDSADAAAQAAAPQNQSFLVKYVSDC